MEEEWVGKLLSIDDDDRRHLEIDRGRYLAIDDDGEYFISTTPQLIRGLPLGGPHPPVVRGGAKPGNRTNRHYAVDRGDTLDHVTVGTTMVYDCWILVLGDRIRNENGEEDDDEFEEYLPIVVEKYPKEIPKNMSQKEARAEVKRQSILKLYADMKRAGIEPPDTKNYDLIIDPDTLTLALLSKPKRKFAHVLRFRYPLMASIAETRKNSIAETRKKRRRA